MTTTLLPTEPHIVSSGGQVTTGGHGIPDDYRPEWSREASNFVPDTWVFFACPHGDSSVDNRWGLGFGPGDFQQARWSLFHCVAEDRFDSRSSCPQLKPSNTDLLRWSSSVVGVETALPLLESVGSCLHFYRQYFAERPDLRGWARR